MHTCECTRVWAPRHTLAHGARPRDIASHPAFSVWLLPTSPLSLPCPQLESGGWAPLGLRSGALGLGELVFPWDLQPLHLLCSVCTNSSKVDCKPEEGKLPPAAALTMSSWGPTQESPQAACPWAPGLVGWGPSRPFLASALWQPLCGSHHTVVFLLLSPPSVTQLL